MTMYKIQKPPSRAVFLKYGQPHFSKEVHFSGCSVDGVRNKDVNFGNFRAFNILLFLLFFGFAFSGCKSGEVKNERIFSPLIDCTTFDKYPLKDKNIYIHKILGWCVYVHQCGWNN